MNSNHFLSAQEQINHYDNTDSYDDDTSSSSSPLSSPHPPSPVTHSDTSSQWSTSSPDLFTDYEHEEVLQQKSISSPQLNSVGITHSPGSSQPRNRAERLRGPKFLDIYYVNQEPPVDFRSPPPRQFHRPILPSRLSRGNLTKQELSYVVHAIRQDNVVVTSQTIHNYASRMISHYKPE